MHPIQQIYSPDQIANMIEMQPENEKLQETILNTNNVNNFINFTTFNNGIETLFTSFSYMNLENNHDLFNTPNISEIFNNDGYNNIDDLLPLSPPVLYRQ